MSFKPKTIRQQKKNCGDKQQATATPALVQDKT